MARLFVSATGTGVGKSHASRLLMEAFAREGIRVGTCKPVETGVTDLPEDAASLLETAQSFNPGFQGFSPRDLCAYTFSLPAAPFCADTNGELSIPRILEKVEELERLCDLLIVEGAGGLLVPLQKEYLMIDLAQDLEAFTLLVTPSRLGCINETLLSLEALEQREIPHDWCVNLHEDAESFPKVTQPFYDAAFPKWWSLQNQGEVDKFVEQFLAELERRNE